MSIFWKTRAVGFAGLLALAGCGESTPAGSELASPSMREAVPAPAPGVKAADVAEGSGERLADTVTVVAYDPALRRLAVESRDGPRIYVVDEAARVVEGGKEGLPSQLEPGMRVAVTAAKRDGHFVAQHLSIVAVGSEPPAAR